MILRVVIWRRYDSRSEKESALQWAGHQAAVQIIKQPTMERPMQICYPELDLQFIWNFLIKSRWKLWFWFCQTSEWRKMEQLRFSQMKRYACSIPLPFGSYIVRETTTPHNYKPVDILKWISQSTIQMSRRSGECFWMKSLRQNWKSWKRRWNKEIRIDTEQNLRYMTWTKVCGTVTTPVTTTHKSIYGQPGISDHAEESEDRTLQDWGSQCTGRYTINKNYVEMRWMLTQHTRWILRVEMPLLR